MRAWTGVGVAVAAVVVLFFLIVSPMVFPVAAAGSAPASRAAPRVAPGAFEASSGRHTVAEEAVGGAVPSAGHGYATSERRQILPVLPLGAGLTCLGLGLAALGLRFRSA